MHGGTPYRVTATSLNVRSGPSIKHSVVGHVHRDDIVHAESVSESGYWLKINTATLRGWAAYKYLQPVVEHGEEEFAWMPIALAEQGVKEFPGTGDNPRIVEYLRSTNLNAAAASHDETAWCSAFANWCVERAGYEGTDSSWALSWRNWGVPIEVPRRGCVAVFERFVSGRNAGGHVGFYIGTSGNRIQLLGGNQRDEVNLALYPVESERYRLRGFRVPG